MYNADNQYACPKKLCLLCILHNKQFSLTFYSLKKVKGFQKEILI